MCGFTAFRKGIVQTHTMSKIFDSGYLVSIQLHKCAQVGPITDPCSTLNGRCGQDNVPDMLVLWCLSEKYDLNHRRAGLEMSKCL